VINVFWSFVFSASLKKKNAAGGFFKGDLELVVGEFGRAAVVVRMRCAAGDMTSWVCWD
jgi:hypothetical protein